MSNVTMQQIFVLPVVIIDVEIICCQY